MTIDTRELLACPTQTQTDLRPGEEPLDGCGCIRLSGPDHEGLIDCDNCGIWFNPTTEYGMGWRDRYRLAAEAERARCCDEASEDVHDAIGGDPGRQCVGAPA